MTTEQIAQAVQKYLDKGNEIKECGPDTNEVWLFNQFFRPAFVSSSQMVNFMTILEQEEDERIGVSK